MFELPDFKLCDKKYVGENFASYHAKFCDDGVPEETALSLVDRVFPNTPASRRVPQLRRIKLHARKTARSVLVKQIQDLVS